MEDSPLFSSVLIVERKIGRPKMEIRESVARIILQAVSDAGDCFIRHNESIEWADTILALDGIYTLDSEVKGWVITEECPQIMKWPHCAETYKECPEQDYQKYKVRCLKPCPATIRDFLDPNITPERE
jgi:hypothetical protein